jgi:MFS superfamily sulfate permease-like transporter
MHNDVWKGIELWEVLLFVVCLLILWFVRRFCTWHRFNRKKGADGDTPINIHPIWGALAAVVMVWLIVRNIYPWLEDHARGDRDWWDNDAFRWLLIIGLALSIGYLVLSWIRRKPCQP